jgi:threonine synthase
MTLAISKAVEEGAKAVICASTGNTSASAAAYAAKAGSTCGVLVPEGQDRPRQAGPGAGPRRDGASRSTATSTRRCRCARTLDEKYPVELVNSVNPYRIEGQKTGAFEVCDQLGAPPTCTSCPSATPATSPPTGAATASTTPTGLIDALPVMRGYQAAGAAPIVEGHPSRSPDDRHRHPHRQPGVVGPGGRGRGDRVPRVDPGRDRPRDPRGLPALARHGVFAEMASAASVAGLLQLHEAGELEPGQTVVCVLTGHGLKDPDWAISGAQPPVTVPADVDAAAAGLALGRALTGTAVGDLDLVRLAAEIEGHPDNVAPAVLGGFVSCATTPAGDLVVRRAQPAPTTGVVVAVPGSRQATSEARAALPASLPRGEVAVQAARASHVTGAFTGLWPGDPALAGDVLHEPPRLAVMRASGALLAELRDAGVHAWLSGAGPTVAAVVPLTDEAPRDLVIRIATAHGFDASALDWDLAGSLVCPDDGCAVSGVGGCATCPRARL